VLRVVLALVVSVGWVAAASTPAGQEAMRPERTHGVGQSIPTAQQWKVVGLGDSVMSGSGCDCDLLSDYAELTRAGTGRDVDTVNLGEGGLTSQGLLDELTSGGPAATAVAGSDVVLVIIGANDLTDDLARWQDGSCDLACFGPDIRTLSVNITRIVERIHMLRAGRPTQILVGNYWNVFEDGTRAVTDHGSAYLALSQRVTEMANQAICAGATSSGAVCVDVAEAFAQAPGGVDALLQDDGDHPNAQGRQVIAKALAAQRWTDSSATP
jgi:lysophospholipase L1-like esterase